MKWLERLEWRVIFRPTAAIRSTPAAYDVDYESVSFPTDDGETLHGWFLPAPTSEADTPGATILWFHGNGGNVGAQAHDVAWLHRRLQVNVLVFDYRGYGRSTGRPTEPGVYRDARAALAYLSSRKDVAADRIVYLGRSLGAAIAVELAQAGAGTQSPAGLVLDSAFTSTKDMARALHRYNPLRFLVPQRFNSLARISQVDCPLLTIHGERDELVPLEQARRLFDAARGPKTFLLRREAGHNADFGLDQEDLWAALGRFLAAVVRNTAGPAGKGGFQQ